MKKLLILVIALALVGGVAMAQVTVGGIVELKVQNEFDAQATSNLGDTRLIISGPVDEYTSVYFRLPAKPTDDANVDRAHATTNIGALLGLNDAGVGLTLNYGYNEFAASNRTPVSGYGFEGLRSDVIAGFVRQRVFLNSGVALKADLMGMVGVYAAFGLNQADLLDNDQQNMIIGLDTAIDVGVGTAFAELAFVQTAEAIADDWSTFSIGAGIKGVEVVEDLSLDFSAGFVYFLDAGTDVGFEPEWKYGVGLNAGYAGLAKMGVSFFGWDGVEAAGLGINVGVTPLDFMGVDLGILLSLDDAMGEEAFNSMEVSTVFNVGAFQYRLGYFHLNDEDAGGIKDLHAVATGYSGLFMRFKATF